MLIKEGTKLRVAHRRKGVFTGYAAGDFDTETTEFYPIKTAQFVNGVANDWDVGESIPCRNTQCTITVLEDK